MASKRLFALFTANHGTHTSQLLNKFDQATAYKMSQGVLAGPST